MRWVPGWGRRLVVIHQMTALTTKRKRPSWLWNRMNITRDVLWHLGHFLVCNIPLWAVPSERNWTCAWSLTKLSVLHAKVLKANGGLAGQKGSWKEEKEAKLQKWPQGNVENQLIYIWEAYENLGNIWDLYDSNYRKGRCVAYQYAGPWEKALKSLGHGRCIYQDFSPFKAPPARVGRRIVLEAGALVLELEAVFVIALA